MSDERGARWLLKLLALGIALLLWFFIAVQRREQVSERMVEAGVTYRPPPGFIILDPIPQVKVRLRGPSRKVRLVSPAMLEVVVSPRSGQEGVFAIPLGPESVIAPDEVEVVAVEPNSLRLRIDRAMTAMVSVRPTVRGEPAAGASLRSVTVTPDRTLVRGPRSKVETLQHVDTSEVLLDGHAFPFSERAAVLSPDPLVQVEPSTVEIQVTLQLPEGRKSGTPP